MDSYDNDTLLLLLDDDLFVKEDEDDVEGMESESHRPTRW